MDRARGRLEARRGYMSQTTMRLQLQRVQLRLSQMSLVHLVV